jgi:hypothetical protein
MKSALTIGERTSQIQAGQLAGGLKIVGHRESYVLGRHILRPQIIERGFGAHSYQRDHHLF